MVPRARRGSGVASGWAALVLLLSGCSGGAASGAAAQATPAALPSPTPVPSAPPPRAETRPPAAAEPTASDDASPPAAGSRGWLGVELGATDTASPGVLVRGLIRGAPAERAGLEPGDVILRIDGEAVARPEDVSRLIGAKSPGQRVSVAFRRAAADRLLAVSLGEMPDRDEMLRKHFVGAEAPAFDDLKAVQGSLPPSLSALRGKVVVVEFWASWCVACRLLVPVMNEWSDRFAARGGMVVGITTDTVELAAATAGQVGMTYPIFSDVSGKTTTAYRAMALPMLFVIDRQGVVREVMVGYSGAGLEALDRTVERLLSEG